MINSVYIGVSLDGYIADRNGGLDWLQSVPNPENLDFGWADFLARVDAIVMGRKTFETVCGFGGEWPYPKPVFVLSRTLTALPEGYDGKAELVCGTSSEVLGMVHAKGHKALYIDGGVAVQGFLKENLIDELIVTTVPILLGGGTPLFGELPEHMPLEHVRTDLFLNALVQSHYRRKGPGGPETAL